MHVLVFLRQRFLRLNHRIGHLPVTPKTYMTGIANICRHGNNNKHLLVDWLGLGHKTNWLGLGKDHGWVLNMYIHD